LLYLRILLQGKGDMKGKVLGFDAASGAGAINGENGQRYTFTAADWKSPAAAKANDNVDFEADGSVAKNIYATSAAASVDLSSMTANPTVAGILAKPSIIWAAIIILGALIGNYFSILSGFGGAAQFLGGGVYLLYLLLLIPVAAAVLIYFELTNHAMTAQFRFITAIAAIAGPIVIPIIVGMTLPQIFGMSMAMGAGNGFFGFAITPGLIFVVGGGVLLLLTHLGYIKKLG
jgi:hypothetical protein